MGKNIGLDSIARGYQANIFVITEGSAGPSMR